MRRRSFLNSVVGGLAGVHVVPRFVLGGGYTPPSEKIRVALIGCGGRGRQVLKGMMEEDDLQVVAVADPAKNYSLQDFYYRDVGGREPTRELIEKKYQAVDAGYKCAAYEDFKELLDQEQDLDAVICATPDHLHAHVTATCLKAGKHVYCEKPLTHNIWEARTIAALAEKTGLATQMGNQGHSTDGIRETCEWIWAGAIGDVHEVKVWVSGHRWNPTLIGRPEGNENRPPEGLNWDLWLGPRAERAYSDAYFPVAWRDFWAFGNSNIGDFGCHDLDAACWALDLIAPTTVDFAPAGVCNQEIGPHGCIGYYQFPANDKRGPVKVTWMDGGLKPDLPRGWPGGKSLPGRGVLFEGSQGTLFCSGAGGRPQLLASDDSNNASREFPKPEASISRVASHARDWLDAIHGNGPAGSHFGYGAKLTELALLGALSLRLGKGIEWDAEQMQVPGISEAAGIIKEGYRHQWTVD